MVRVFSVYVLVISFGVRDVLGYFLRVRGEVIVFVFEVDEEERVVRNLEDVIRVLGLYI